MMGILRAAPIVVRSIGADLEALRSIVNQLRQLLKHRGSVQSDNPLPFSESLKRVLKQADAEAANFAGDTIGPGHLLLVHPHGAWTRSLWPPSQAIEI